MKQLILWQVNLVSHISYVLLVSLIIKSGSSQEQFNEDENVFVLESYPSYSAVLPITLKNEGEISFVVKSPRFHRVMGVIQFINLPLNKDFTCASFLQFQDGIDTKSEKICGNFDPDEKSFQPASLVGKRSYISSRDTLKVSLVNQWTVSQDSYARIAFTAFRDDCYFPTLRNSSSDGTPRYRPCEYSMNADGIGRQCIVSSLFCDQTIQCAGIDKEGTDFGEDESAINCPHVYHHMKEQILSSSFVDSSIDNHNDNFVQTSSNSSTTANGVNKNDLKKNGGVGVSGNEGTFKRFFDEREEHLANLFKSAIIGFVGLCTICVLVAFIVAMFCMRSSHE